MDVSSWENHLFLWAIFHRFVKYPEGIRNVHVNWPWVNHGINPTQPDVVVFFTP
jgi:hypothetical protein